MQHSTGRDTCWITAIYCADIFSLQFVSNHVILSVRDVIKCWERGGNRIQDRQFECLLQLQTIITPTKLLVYCHFLNPISGVSQSSAGRFFSTVQPSFICHFSNHISLIVDLSQHQEHLPIMELFKRTHGAAIKVRPASQQFHRQCNVKKCKNPVHYNAFYVHVHTATWQIFVWFGKIKCVANMFSMQYVFNAMLNKLVSEKSHWETIMPVYIYTFSSVSVAVLFKPMLLLCRQKLLITKSGRIFVQLFLSDFDYQRTVFDTGWFFFSLVPP